MTVFGYIVLFSLVPVVFVLFATLPPRKAVIYSFIWGWLFLPQKAIAIHGLTEYGKLSATPLAVLLAAIIFDIDRVLALRPRIWDIPMALYILCPFVSSYHNGLGLYDGGNASIHQFYYWGGGYLVGRIYFNDLEGLKELAFGFILGGLVYMPFCLWESRMSPQLHAQIYGFSQHAFDETRRMGGFRPMVFMQHGLAVAMWMMSAALCAWWLWLCGTFKRKWNLSATFWVVAMAFTCLICRSGGAFALGFAGICVLWTLRWPRTRLAVLALMLIPPSYTYFRARNQWTGEDAVAFVRKFNKRAADSLQFRLKSETLLIARAWESPIWGWGGWDHNEVFDEKGRKIAIPDQQWVIAFGKTGLVGVVCFETALLLPLLVLMLRVPVRYWTHPAVAPAAVLAVIVVLHLCDCMENAMVNPFFMMACGGVTGLLPVTITVVSQRRAAGAAPYATRNAPLAQLAGPSSLAPQ